MFVDFNHKGHKGLHKDHKDCCVKCIVLQGGVSNGNIVRFLMFMLLVKNIAVKNKHLIGMALY
jgi:hypothetical protein